MADPGHEATEEILRELERRIAEEYAQAVEEVEGKLSDYLRRFAIKDKQWRKWVADGTVTQEEYRKWRVGQIAVGKRWEEMRDSLARDYHNANAIARSVIDGYMPDIYALNHNYGTFQVESGGVDTSYTLYSRETAERIFRENPEMLPPPGKAVSQRIAAGLDVAWNKEQIQSVMLQGLLQGESIPVMARRLATKVGDKNFKAAVRNARTMATGAQNAGRYDAYRRADKMGIDLTIEWAATLDGRTRHEHRMLHGQRRNVDEPFQVDGVSIYYPGQTAGESTIPQSMIWNCRCTLLAWVKGYEHDTIRQSDRMGGMSFEEWLEAKEEPHPILEQYEKGKSIRDDYVQEYATGVRRMRKRGNR